tara:strand:+ start:2055 stop:2435 length:381 start_codon:yes stop_codon:yes gene_type:complete
MTIRSERAASQIQRELAPILRSSVRDPQLADVVITRVTVSNDLRHARIYYALVKGVESEAEHVESTKGVEAAFTRAKGFIKFQLGKSLGLRVVPEIEFVLDVGYEEGMHILETISDIVSDNDGASE